ncbi:MAG: MoxR-like ATPase [Parcubacteria group bacterium Gr01-1014_66]|nr:MAG: MoxR-like ATPase [Parcubacteria group bacterium Gr01-1014_66]
MSVSLEYVNKFIDPDFGPDPYFAKISKPSPAGDRHLEYMFRIIWPLLASYRKVLVAQRAMTTYTVLSQIAAGERDLDYLGAGHILYTDYPGKGKTLLAKVPAIVFGGKFTRFQGTSDNLPSDFTGNRILDIDENGKRFFRFVQGPAFGDFILVDEVNRNSPKTLSGLHEPFGEGTVTNFGKTYHVRPYGLFTMNPIETEGTYPLPEALLDRIMFKITGEWFTKDQFAEILERTNQYKTIRAGLKQVCGIETIHEIREFFHTAIYVDSDVRKRMGHFAEVSNDPYRFNYLRSFTEKFDGPIIRSGLSGRGIIYWEGATRALAGLRYRDYVCAEDAKKVLLPILRHRIIFEPGALLFLTHELGLRDTTETADVIITTLIKEAW